MTVPTVPSPRACSATAASSVVDERGLPLVVGVHERDRQVRELRRIDPRHVRESSVRRRPPPAPRPSGTPRAAAVRRRRAAQAGRERRPRRRGARRAAAAASGSSERAQRGRDRLERGHPPATGRRSRVAGGAGSGRRGSARSAGTRCTIRRACDQVPSGTTSRTGGGVPGGGGCGDGNSTQVPGVASAEASSGSPGSPCSTTALPSSASAAQWPVFVSRCALARVAQEDDLDPRPQRGTAGQRHPGTGKRQRGQRFASSGHAARYHAAPARAGAGRGLAARERGAASARALTRRTPCPLRRSLL